jgi:RNA polymerase sigma-70 factor (ECF subfamily)
MHLAFVSLLMAEPCGLTLAQLSDLSDEIVMSHLVGGHDDGLTVIFDRYHHLVFSIGLRILRDINEAEDVMQSVFLEIYKSAAKFDPAKGSLKVWILQYAYHRSMNRKKYLKLRQFGEREEIGDIQEHPGLGYARLAPQEISSLLRQALRQLTAAQRKTLEAVYFRGASFKEIAAETGESVGNIYHHYYRGLDRLREVVLAEPGVKGSQLVRRGVIDAEA